MKRRWLIVIVILLGISIGGYFFLSSRKAQTPAVASVETYTVTRGDLLVSVSGSGVLEAKDTVDITSEVGGTVIWVAEEGSRVKKGDILCKIDPHDYELAVTQAELNYKNAKLKLEQAKINLESQKKQLEQNIRDAQTNRDNAYIELQKAKRQLDDAERLYKANAITLNELKTYRDNYSKALNAYNQAVENLRLLESTKADKLAQAERDVALAESSLEQARLDLDKAKLNLSKTVIYAPIDGIVADVSVKRGGQNIAKETTLMSVLDTSTMKIKLEVDETDIPKVKIGLPVRITC
ncbi:HlyD family secretion protein, partial [bacterium]|nr:HlyD family secretion protein [bacterium]